ncbi:hypothetical protein AALP_AA4G213100 [Arabis alpina]|uniref:Uncharacterized protein n=1 Tax=Arabis alpina TaxID=50452 RepID=A0A087H4P9_ARAAL|nr:hypothetical protein AALP_AA4G213100 [Arabis alpina]
MVFDGKIKRGEEDLISSLPDVILQEILCFIPTKLAITTSLLSKRWRHVWCEIPSFSIDADIYKREEPVWCTPSNNKTLNRYTAPRIMNFNLNISSQQNIPYRDKWIEFAMSRNVENLSLDFSKACSDENYKLPDFFYISSSLKQLTLEVDFCDMMIPIPLVSWTSLMTLSLRWCAFSDKSMAKILSGCPILESLTLYSCNKLMVLDLSKSMRLRTLQVKRHVAVSGPMEILAPYIRLLRLESSQLPCTFVDVSSLREAKLDICFIASNPNLKADILQITVLKMLDKLHNVEKLTLGENFLQILSLAELRGVTFPMLKIKALTLETKIFQYVIPGIERLLQNSPDIENLTLLPMNRNTIPGGLLDKYLKSQCLNIDECWRSKDGVFWNKSYWNVESNHVISLVELMLKNTMALAKIVLLLDERYLQFKVKDLVPRLSHYNNVAIALLKQTNTHEEW